MATIEKYQAESAAPNMTGAEAKIISAARQIKAVKPELPVLFYLNR